MRKFAVIGLGKFGNAVATILFDNGAEVLVIDNNDKKLQDLRGRVSAAIKMDCTDERALRSVGIDEVDAVILAVGDVETSVLTCVLLKKLGVMNIQAKVDSELHARILEIMGVTNVLFPEKQVGEQLAHTLLSPNVLNYINLTSGHCIAELKVPEAYVGKTLQELNLPNEMKIHIVAIKYTEMSVSESGDNVIETRINDMPGANDIIKEGDILVLMGSTSNVSNLINKVTPGMRVTL
ncbi:MAG: TrkA family potassium uptake protein [Candidatus Cloacimonas sp.]|nr:TrkA family potassium uptake protein [Candidatus Cloacimonadota bacterium]